jgi:hypothetical protein
MIGYTAISMPRQMLYHSDELPRSKQSHPFKRRCCPASARLVKNAITVVLRCGSEHYLLIAAASNKYGTAEQLCAAFKALILNLFAVFVNQKKLSRIDTM